MGSRCQCCSHGLATVSPPHRSHPTPPPPPTLQVSDFGLAKLRPIEGSEHEPMQMTGETGSYRFMAPEVFRHEAYGAPARSNGAPTLLDVSAQRGLPGGWAPATKLGRPGSLTEGDRTASSHGL